MSVGKVVHIGYLYTAGDAGCAAGARLSQASTSKHIWALNVGKNLQIFIITVSYLLTAHAHAGDAGRAAGAPEPGADQQAYLGAERGENFQISIGAWERFTKALEATAVGYMYVSEHHLGHTDLKIRMRDVIRVNRKWAPNHIPCHSRGD